MTVDEEILKKIKPWWALSFDGRVILDKILEQWNYLITDSSVTEPMVQTFLAEHAGFFLKDSGHTQLAISKMKIGRYETDFVLGYEEGSQGFLYNLVEIESPSDNAYTKSGNPSAELNRALQQIRDWRETVETDIAHIEKLLPFTGGRKYGPSRFRYSIIIGTREKNKQWQDKIYQLAQQNNVIIRSFDSFSERFMENRYSIFPHYFSAEIEDLNPLVRNALANPFLQALTDSSWAKIVNDGRFSAHHTVAKNADIFLDQHQVNSRCNEFLKTLEGLTDEAKTNIRNENLRQLKIFKF